MPASHGIPQKEGWGRVWQLRGYLAGSARQQNTADGQRSPPQLVFRAHGDPAGETKWSVTEPFYHRYDGRDSSATRIDVKEANPVVYMLYPPYKSV